MTKSGKIVFARRKNTVSAQTKEYQVLKDYEFKSILTRALIPRPHLAGEKPVQLKRRGKGEKKTSYINQKSLIGGRELPEDLRQKVNPTTGVLVIDPVQKGPDAGLYTCWAKNKQGQTAKRSGEISVIGELLWVLRWFIMRELFQIDTMFINFDIPVTCHISFNSIISYSYHLHQP